VLLLLWPQAARAFKAGLDSLVGVRHASKWTQSILSRIRATGVVTSRKFAGQMP
jgi:hypothetical protein